MFAVSLRLALGFDEKKAEDLRADCQRWGFQVLKDFLAYIRESEHDKLLPAMRELDGSDSMRQVIEWFQEHDAAKLIADYRKAVGTRGSMNVGS